MFLSTRRILRFSWQHFWRNIWLSFVTVTIIILTLVSITTLFFINAITDSAISSVRDNIDVSLYFSNDISLEAVTLIREELAQIEEVKEVYVISPEDALENFRANHADDVDIQETLAELEQNPLGPTIVLLANDIDDYPIIMDQVSGMEITDIVEKIDYDDHRALIQNIDDFSTRLESFALTLSIIFLIIAIMTVFNTVRMGIYIHRREIGIMRLVGANNWFIRLPFVVEGVFYALFGSLLFWGIVFIALHFINPWLNTFFAGISFNTQDYLIANAFRIFLIEFLLIAFITVLSALTAMRKYLKI